VSKPTKTGRCIVKGLTPQVKRAIDEAVEEVKDTLAGVGCKYFHSYHVLDVLRTSFYKEYLALLCAYQSDDEPFRGAHKQIARYMEREAHRLGIEKVLDQGGEEVRIFIEETIVGTESANQVWKVVK